MSFNGLKEISVEQAKLLAQFGSREHQYARFQIDTLRSYPQSTVRLRAQQPPPGSHLSLNGLRSLNSEALKALLEYNGLSIGLKGIKLWTDNQVKLIEQSE